MSEEAIKAMSALVNRFRFVSRIGTSHNGERDYYDVLGYPGIGGMSFEDYWNMYDRNPIAGNIVEKPVFYSWKNSPKIIEDQDNDTQFEKDIKEIRENTKLFHYMKRADKISGIGQFGILLIGTSQGNLNEPLEDNSLSGPGDILYTKPYHQGSVEIKEYYEDASNKKFGKPKFYNVKIDFPATGQTKTKEVHESRIIHIAEDKDESDVIGRPRLKRAYNNLIDLLKVVGGGAETFWLNARNPKQFQPKEDYDFGPGEKEETEAEIEKFYNKLTRWIKTKGIEINELNNEIADPSSSFETIIKLLAASANMPVRILIGNEAGELASSQDERNWLSYIESRRENYVNPEILEPFVDWCIDKGAISEPEDSYKINWPNLFQLSAKEKSEILSDVSDALSNMSPDQDVTKLLEDATLIVDIIEEYTSLNIDRDKMPDKNVSSLLEITRKLREDQDISQETRLEIIAPLIDGLEVKKELNRLDAEDKKEYNRIKEEMDQALAGEE
ncbi:anti-CBASS protein Acb1 family protein [Fuchsiella alkaliacetigena]|uniref:anti-CBASS protein Acb1 family protein n=1 Tax=Fuchsiella alkaliacetigena TaxID=957042 RepID=UPI00200A129D|nr:anti-CBASS Acb1 family protein [Fuchsiella alkaliacetigena]MCK8824721.1 DUF1073 domain-containing protein [Fuchsiella alkaliacetigena]